MKDQNNNPHKRQGQDTENSLNPIQFDQHQPARGPDLDITIGEVQAPNYNNMLPTQGIEVLNILTNELRWHADFCVLPMMVTAAAAIGSARTTSIAGYTVKSILWGCSVGSPSINKSEPLKFAVEPLKDAFRQNVNNYNQALMMWEQLPEEEKKSESEPVLVENVMSDITIEKVGYVLQHNPKGAMMAVDELKGWFNSFDRYSKGNAEQTYLELFNGTSMAISRMSRETIFVLNPNLSIAGTSQPDVICRTFSKASENGLKERLLYVYPDVEPLPWNKKATKTARDQAARKWANIISPLYGLKHQTTKEGRMEPIYLPMESEAEDQLFAWNESNTERKKSNSIYAGVLGKADIICPRLALILQLVDKPASDRIEEANAIRAINMMEYFLTHSLKVMRMISVGAPTSPTSKKKLYDELPDKFTTSDALIKGSAVNVAEATIKRYLNDTTFFQKEKHGEYRKV